MHSDNKTIERLFTTPKKNVVCAKHYTRLTQVTNWVRLKFAVMNLKKYAINKFYCWFVDFIAYTIIRIDRLKH